MSYCVNCGVELDKTCSVCPLCNTKVYNPNQEIDHISPTPFPTRKGYASPVQKSDITLLISIVLAVTAAVCGLLNIFVFQGSSWSMYVIGGCVLLWIFCLPVFFYRMNAYLSILLDGAGIAMYFGIISWLHPGNGWYRLLALPAIAAATGLILIFAVCVRQAHTSILASSALILGEAALFTVALELLIDRFRQAPPGITWSAIVLTCCAIIDAALITIIRRIRLREEVRRRMHI